MDVSNRNRRKILALDNNSSCSPRSDNGKGTDEGKSNLFDGSNRNRNKKLLPLDRSAQSDDEDDILNISNHSEPNQPTTGTKEKTKAQRRGSDSEIRAMAIDMLESMGTASIRDLGRKKPVAVASKRNITSEKDSSKSDIKSNPSGSTQSPQRTPLNSQRPVSPAPSRTPRESLEKETTTTLQGDRTSPTISQRPVPTMGAIGRPRSGTFNTSGINVARTTLSNNGSASATMSNKSGHGITPRDSNGVTPRVYTAGSGLRSRQSSNVGALSRQNSNVLVRHNINVTATTSDRPLSSPLSRQGSMIPLSRSGTTLLQY